MSADIIRMAVRIIIIVIIVIFNIIIIIIKNLEKCLAELRLFLLAECLTRKRQAGLSGFGMRLHDAH